MGPDPICRIRLTASKSVPFFQRRPGSYRTKRPGSDHGWPGIVTAKRIWSRSKPVCKKYRARLLQNATSPIPVSHFQTRLSSSTDGRDLILRNQSGSDLVLADCQVRAERIRSGSEPVCKNHRVRFWTTLVSRSGLGANWIRHY